MTLPSLAVRMSLQSSNLAGLARGRTDYGVRVLSNDAAAVFESGQGPGG